MDFKMKRAIEKYRYIVTVVFLFAVTAYRLGKIYTREVFNDFNAYYDVTGALLHGLSPYKLENLSLHWVDAPIVFPGYSALFFPFLVFELDTAKYIYLSLNIILGIILAVSLFKKILHIDTASLISGGKNAYLFALSLFMFLNSAPFMTSLKQGQTSVLLAFSLFMIISSGPSFNIFKYYLMSAAAVLKYTIMPFYGIILFVKKEFKVCLIGFLLFLLWAVVPVFLGHNLLSLYTQYIDVLRSQVGSGFNSFPVSGYNMVQLDCFKIPFVGALLKLFLISLFIYIFIKRFKKKGIGLNFMFMTMCLTMNKVYHRVYDVTIIMPLLIMVFISLLDSRRWYEAFISFSFILFFLLPESLVFRIADFMGSVIGPNKVVYLSVFTKWKTLFPLFPMVLLAMSIFSFYLCFFLKEKFSFLLENGE
jgi:hypothetical protein